jgi:uncharacterized repeat protein (TIGR01451 family)
VDRSRAAAESDAAIGPARLQTQATTAGAGDDGTMRYSLAVPTGDRASSAVLVEKVAPKEARLNRPYDYRIRVTNLTDTPLVGVVVKEKVVENFEITRSEPAGKVEEGWTNYALGELPPMGSKTIEVSGVAKGEGKLSTVIAVDYQPTLRASSDVVNPILKLAKEGPADADICEGIRYKYTVSNVGTGTEHDVVIEDALPEGLVTDDGKKVVSIRIGDLAQSMSKEVSVRVKPDKTGRYASAAVARAPGGVEVKSQEVATAVHQPKLEVTVSGPPTEYLNKSAAYTVTVKNVGDAPARHAQVAFGTAGRGQVSGVVVTDRVEGEPRVASSPAALKEATDLETLKPGESKSVTVTVRAAKEGEMPLVATALATCVAPVTASARTNILTLPALRLEVVDLDDPIRVGGDVVYRITVKNQGTGADKNVSVTATLPAELTFVGAMGPSEAKAEGQTIRFGTLETLASGDQAVWRLQAKGTKAGDVRFEVQLTSDSLKKPATETEPTRLY